MQDPEQTPMQAAQEKEKKELKPEDVDVNVVKHTGQIALRKLYHESKRPLLVFYTAPGCGPCRTLKPILNGVLSEFESQVQYFNT